MSQQRRRFSLGELSEEMDPASAAKWFLDSKKRLGAKMLVAEETEMIIGSIGMISDRDSGKGRFVTVIVVSPDDRRLGISSLLLHKTLSDLNE
jgi:hypothetical protein